MAMNQLTDADRAAYGAWHEWRQGPGTEALIAAAVLAPSHNNQPWRFRLDANGVDILPDELQRLGTLDPSDRELHISLGCATENLVLAARAQGFETQVSISDEPPRVRVDLAPRADGERNRLDSELFGVIGARHTNRGPYTSVATSAGLLAELSRQAAPTDDLEVQWLTEWSDREAFGTLLTDAAEAVAADVQQSEDNF